jgi:hypothetical protein
MSYNPPVPPPAVKGTNHDESTPVSNASTYAWGNLGIQNNSGAVAGSPPTPACDGNGYLQITAGMGLTIRGKKNYKPRQLITFSVSTTSPAALQVTDALGYAFMTIYAGQQIALATDSPLIVSGAGGTSAVTIGQIFLA